jgi:hypothetical protein
MRSGVLESNSDILPPTAFVICREFKISDGSRVGPQVVRDDRIRRKALFPQKLAYQPDRSALVALALDQDVKDFPLGIDRAPQVHPAHIDTNVHFIQMPGGMRPFNSRKRQPTPLSFMPIPGHLENVG